MVRVRLLAEARPQEGPISVVEFESGVHCDAANKLGSSSRARAHNHIEAFRLPVLNQKFNQC